MARSLSNPKIASSSMFPLYRLVDIESIYRVDILARPAGPPSTDCDREASLHYARFPLRRAESLMPRVLLIGWDGADWRILDPLLEAGVLPNLQALVDRGAKGILKSTIPTHSWAAWPSFLTGVDPADHGVYDILESVPGTHKQFPVTYRSIKERTMIPDLNAAGKRTLLVNVPLTFPPPETNGRLIAGGVLPKGRDFTYPSELAGGPARAGRPGALH